MTTQTEQARVTQADREAAEKFGSAWRMNAAGKFGLANLLAAHRLAAIEEAAGDEATVERVRTAIARALDQDRLSPFDRLDLAARAAIRSLALKEKQS